MLIHEGDTRTPKTDLILASTLAFVAGGVNSAGFIAYQYFSANMTGNVSMASEMLSVSRYDAAIGFLTVVAMFILGAFLASAFIEVGKQRSHDNIYALTLLAEAVLLVMVGVMSVASSRPPNGILMVGLLALTMGIQNAASTRISGNRVRTTHVSGIATDIGVGLALLMGKRSQDERRSTAVRLKLHLATITSFAVGGIAGVLGHQTLGGGTFCILAAILLGMSLRYVKSR